MTRHVIRFYRVGDPYGEFSNFAPYPIVVDGVEWPTSEHYFQAQKFAGTPHAERIRLTPSPMVAARRARSRDLPLRPDWDQVRVAVMRRALQAKFTQHTQLRELLLSTGDAELVEHTERDAFWGDGGDGTGENMLGKLLMELRTQLRRTAC
ncbi:MAG TPA: NADAR family protein [Pseudonocardiaceae bacterium]